MTNVLSKPGTHYTEAGRIFATEETETIRLQCIKKYDSEKARLAPHIESESHTCFCRNLCLVLGFPRF